MIENETEKREAILPMPFSPFISSLSFPIWELRIVILAFINMIKMRKHFLKYI